MSNNYNFYNKKSINNENITYTGNPSIIGSEIENKPFTSKNIPILNGNVISSNTMLLDDGKKPFISSVINNNNDISTKELTIKLNSPAYYRPFPKKITLDTELLKTKEEYSIGTNHGVDFEYATKYYNELLLKITKIRSKLKLASIPTKVFLKNEKYYDTTYIPITPVYYNLSIIRATTLTDEEKSGSFESYSYITNYYQISAEDGLSLTTDENGEIIIDENVKYDESETFYNFCKNYLTIDSVDITQSTYLYTANAELYFDDSTYKVYLKVILTRNQDVIDDNDVVDMLLDSSNYKDDSLIYQNFLTVNFNFEKYPHLNSYHYFKTIFYLLDNYQDNTIEVDFNNYINSDVDYHYDFLGTYNASNSNEVYGEYQKTNIYDKDFYTNNGNNYINILSYRFTELRRGYYSLTPKSDMFSRDFITTLYLTKYARKTNFIGYHPHGCYYTSCPTGISTVISLKDLIEWEQDEKNGIGYQNPEKHNIPLLFQNMRFNDISNFNKISSFSPQLDYWLPNKKIIEIKKQINNNNCIWLNLPLGLKNFASLLKYFNIDETENYTTTKGHPGLLTETEEIYKNFNKIYFIDNTSDSYNETNINDKCSIIFTRFFSSNNIRYYNTNTNSYISNLIESCCPCFDSFAIKKSNILSELKFQDYFKGNFDTTDVYAIHFILPLRYQNETYIDKTIFHTFLSTFEYNDYQTGYYLPNTMLVPAINKAKGSYYGHYISSSPISRYMGQDIVEKNIPTNALSKKIIADMYRPISNDNLKLYKPTYENWNKTNYNRIEDINMLSPYCQSTDIIESEEKNNEN